MRFAAGSPIRNVQRAIKCHPSSRLLHRPSPAGPECPFRRFAGLDRVSFSVIAHKAEEGGFLAESPLSPVATQRKIYIVERLARRCGLQRMALTPRASRCTARLVREAVIPEGWGNGGPGPSLVIRSGSDRLSATQRSTSPLSRFPSRQTGPALCSLRRMISSTLRSASIRRE